MPSEEVLIALDSLHKELSRLQPAIKHVETAELVIKTVESVPQLHLDLLERIKEDDRIHKDSLKELFKTELADITTETRKIANVTAQLQDQMKIELDEIGKLRDTIKAFHDKVDRINFPERLDKLDVTIAGIMTAVHSLHSRLESIERNVLDRLQGILERHKEAELRTQNAINITSRRQQTYAYITWGLITVGTVLLYILRSR
jgi:chromosome segregation ATPase